jgi:hypothetical protein
MNSSPQHSHAQLYIAAGIILLFAASFFIFKSREETSAPTSAAPDTPMAAKTPVQKRVSLTPLEQTEKKAILSDPVLSARTTLTRQEQIQKDKMLENPAYTARAAK